MFGTLLNFLFFQAIELSAESLSNVKFIQEKKLIGNYFDQISQDTGKYCFGVEDTLRALEMGAVDVLICWENLDVQRYTLKNSSTGDIKILHLSHEQEKDVTHFQVRLKGRIQITDSCKFYVEWTRSNLRRFRVMHRIDAVIW